MMRLRALVSLLISAAVPFAVAGCKRSPNSSLKGQVNATITFHGLVVDQDGTPLPGARIEYTVSAYPKDWSFDTRGRPYDVSSFSATSDPQGRFSVPVTGCILRLSSATREGYRHLTDNDTSNGPASTYSYGLIAWGDAMYKSDPERPAVYVFVKDGVREVSAVPCRGGYDSGNGTHWRPNKPAWPREPSLPDVLRKQPPLPAHP
ncbi:MAG TPA: hypothetical protein VER17_05240 [Tepidisphaeraceae bacterium]|nr:hypothetical protein [Tepidisphaeraceae bacterium]